MRLEGKRPFSKKGKLAFLVHFQEKKLLWYSPFAGHFLPSSTNKREISKRERKKKCIYQYHPVSLNDKKPENVKGLPRIYHRNL